MHFQYRPINITIYGTEVGNGFITWDGFFIPFTSTYSTKYSPKQNYYDDPYKCCIYRLRADHTKFDYQCKYVEDTCPPPQNRDWELLGASSPVPNCSHCRNN
ncbi:hypothetical protein CN938_29385 [Bacillus thuringiensis]|nr:hypothetical protein CN938_29385 [Bacillus thuringiensis]